MCSCIGNTQLETKSGVFVRRRTTVTLHTINSSCTVNTHSTSHLVRLVSTRCTVWRLSRPRGRLVRAAVHTDATPQAEAPAQEDAQWVHQGVSCDACGMNPIVGARFKSLTIENFDLCAACEVRLPTSQTLPAHHPSAEPHRPELCCVSYGPTVTRPQTWWFIRQAHRTPDKLATV